MPHHLDYKLTAQKLTEKRVKTSQIMSSKNSQCLSLHSYDESGGADFVNQFGPNTYNNIIDDIMITTIDKKKTAINNFVGNNFDRNQLLMQTSRVVVN
jgi:hypothetical protein